MRVLRKFLAGLARDRFLVLADQLDPVVGSQVGIERIALAVLEGVEDVLEMMMLEAEMSSLAPNSSKNYVERMDQKLSHKHIQVV